MAGGHADPPNAAEALTVAGILFVLLTKATDSASMVSKIIAVADALDLPGEALVAEVQGGLDAAASRPPP